MVQIKKYNFKNKENNVVGSLEVENNKLYIYGDILMDSFFKYEESEDICPKDIVDFLKDLGNNSEIEIHINSGGGSVFGGLAIYNLLKSYKGKKTVYIDGLAGSIASVIALAGDEVYTYESSFFMIHNPLTAICGYFNAKELKDYLQEQIEILEKCKKSIVNVYMENVKQNITEEKITELMDNETWFLGNQVTEYFKMNVIENKNNMVACTSSYFEKYKNTPKNILNINKNVDDEILKDNKNKKLEKEKQEILNDLEKISIF